MIKSNSREVSSIRLQANERIGTPERNSSRDHQIQPNWFEQSTTDVANKRPADVFSSLQTARDRSVSKENTRSISHNKLKPLDVKPSTETKDPNSYFPLKIAGRTNTFEEEGMVIYSRLSYKKQIGGEQQDGEKDPHNALHMSAQGIDLDRSVTTVVGRCRDCSQKKELVDRDSQRKNVYAPITSRANPNQARIQEGATTARLPEVKKATSNFSFAPDGGSESIYKFGYTTRLREFFQVAPSTCEPSSIPKLSKTSSNSHNVNLFEQARQQTKMTDLPDGSSIAQITAPEQLLQGSLTREGFHSRTESISRIQKTTQNSVPLISPSMPHINSRVPAPFIPHQNQVEGFPVLLARNESPTKNVRETPGFGNLGSYSSANINSGLDHQFQSRNLQRELQPSPGSPSRQVNIREHSQPRNTDGPIHRTPMEPQQFGGPTDIQQQLGQQSHRARVKSPPFFQNPQLYQPRPAGILDFRFPDRQSNQIPQTLAPQLLNPQFQAQRHLTRDIFSNQSIPRTLRLPQFEPCPVRQAVPNVDRESQTQRDASRGQLMPTTSQPQLRVPTTPTQREVSQEPQMRRPSQQQPSPLQRHPFSRREPQIDQPRPGTRAVPRDASTEIPTGPASRPSTSRNVVSPQRGATGYETTFTTTANLGTPPRGVRYETHNRPAANPASYTSTPVTYTTALNGGMITRGSETPSRSPVTNRTGQTNPINSPVAYGYTTAVPPNYGTLANAHGIAQRGAQQDMPSFRIPTGTTTYTTSSPVTYTTTSNNRPVVPVQQQPRQQARNPTGVTYTAVLPPPIPTAEPRRNQTPGREGHASTNRGFPMGFPGTAPIPSEFTASARTVARPERPQRQAQSPPPQTAARQIGPTPQRTNPNPNPSRPLRPFDGEILETRQGFLIPIIQIPIRDFTFAFEHFVCTVCCDSVSQANDTCQLQCDHRFHSNCVAGWIKDKGTCPVCRQKVTELNCASKR